jgi:hypothetical protein
MTYVDVVQVPSQDFGPPDGAPFGDATAEYSVAQQFGNDPTILPFVTEKGWVQDPNQEVFVPPAFDPTTLANNFVDEPFIILRPREWWVGEPDWGAANPPATTDYTDAMFQFHFVGVPLDLPFVPDASWVQPRDPAAPDQNLVAEFDVALVGFTPTWLVQPEWLIKFPESVVESWVLFPINDPTIPPVVAGDLVNLMNHQTWMSRTGSRRMIR